MRRHKPKPFDEPGLSRLERLRRFHGLTLRDLEARSEVPKTSLGKMMKGHFPDVREAIRVAKIFDATVEDIWGDAALKQPIKPACQVTKQALTES